MARKKKTLKLATFNVNGIGARLPHLLAWLEKEHRGGHPRDHRRRHLPAQRQSAGGQPGADEPVVDRWVRLQHKASDHAPTWVTVKAPA